MKFIKSLNFVNPLRKGPPCREVLQSTVFHLWDVYSAPRPAGGRQVLTLLSLCLMVAVVTGGLLYHWLWNTLRYDHEMSFGTAGVYGACMFLCTVLCHPLRCVLALTLPTVCTAQGRKLIVSAAVMILVLNVIPNIAVNVGAVTHVLKCSSEGFASALLNSTGPLARAKKDLVDAAIEVKQTQKELNIVTNLKKFDEFTHIDVSEVKMLFKDMSGRIEVNVSHARSLLNHYKLLSNRILAAIFVFLLIIESARYLKSYLTMVRFDNGNLSKDLLRTFGNGRTQISADNKTRLTSCKITSDECSTSVISLAVVTLYFIAISLIIALDHAVYYIVDISVSWLLDFPPTSAGISVNFKAEWFMPFGCILHPIAPELCGKQELTNFHQDYKWTFSPELSLCDVTMSPPHQGVRLLLGFLWLMSYCLVFLEVYARRIRTKVSASFFKQQEKKRVDFLLQKMQAKQKSFVNLAS